MPIKSCSVDMFCEDVAWGVFSLDFVKSKITSPQTVLDPKVCCGEVSYLSPPAPAAHPHSRGGISLDGYRPIEAKVPCNALEPQGNRGSFADAGKFGLS